MVKKVIITPPEKLLGATVTTHWPKSDPDMFGDYYDVDIHISAPDGREYGIQYGDSYHDKGWEKADGFVDALKILYGNKLPILKIKIADREDI